HHFPCSQFWISQEDSPELNEIPVRWALAASRGAHKLFQLKKSLPGAIGIDSTFSGFLVTKLAEAGHFARINWRRVMGGAKTVAKCALPLRSPHDSINVIGTREVFDEPRKEIPVIRVIDA